MLTLFFCILLPQPRKDLWNELLKSMFGYSEHTFAALYFYVMHATNGFISQSRKQHYVKKGKLLREKLLNKLGTNGVLFYPTFPQSALRHGESTTKLSGVMYTAFFNIMGFPSTHVPVNHIKISLFLWFSWKLLSIFFFYFPLLLLLCIHIDKKIWQMGLDDSGLPIGFQVCARVLIWIKYQQIFLWPCLVALLNFSSSSLLNSVQLQVFNGDY